MIYLRGRVRPRERWRDLLCIGSLPKWPQWLPRLWTTFCVSHVGTGTQALGPSLLLSQAHLIGHWIKSGVTGTRTDSYMACWDCRW